MIVAEALTYINEKTISRKQLKTVFALIKNNPNQLLSFTLKKVYSTHLMVKLRSKIYSKKFKTSLVNIVD